MNERRDQSRTQKQKGISIIEILISIAIAALVFIPAIQILFSLQSENILQIVRGDAGAAGNVLKAQYDFDGGQRSISGRGAMWSSGLVTEHARFNSREISGTHMRHTCTDMSLGSVATSISRRSDPHVGTNPTLHLYTTDELGLSSTTRVTGMSTVGASLFLSVDSSSTTEPDVLAYSLGAPNIYDTPDPFGKQKPQLTMVSSKDTGPGISQLQAAGPYLIAANTGVRSQANVISLSADPQQIIVIGNVTDLVIPGSNSSTTPITKNIVYADGKIVIGTEKSVLPEIFIFSARDGRVLGSIEIGYGINDMLVLNDLLVVAGPRDPEIEIFNLVTLLKVGEYDLPGGSGNAKTLAAFGDYLYVGRTKGGDEFQIFRMDRTDDDPRAPFEPRLSPLFRKKIQWSIDALIKHDRYTALLTADEYNEFKLYQQSDPAEEPQLAYSLDLPYRTYAASCFKNGIWIAFRDVGAQNPYALGLLVFN